MNAFHVVLLTLALTASNALAQQPEAAKLLDRVDGTAADTKTRAGLKTLVTRGKIKAAGMPGAGTFEHMFLGREKVKLATSWPGMGTSTQGSTGTFCWSTDPAMGVDIKKMAEAGSVLRMFGAYRRDRWRDLYTSAKTVAKVDLGKQAEEHGENVTA